MTKLETCMSKYPVVNDNIKTFTRLKSVSLTSAFKLMGRSFLLKTPPYVSTAAASHLQRCYACGPVHLVSRNVWSLNKMTILVNSVVKFVNFG